jgi:hypothetical protein
MKNLIGALCSFDEFSMNTILGSCSRAISKSPTSHHSSQDHPPPSIVVVRRLRREPRYDKLDLRSSK